MSDNTQTDLATSAGDIIASEDIAGVKHQRVKLIDATIGSTEPVGTAANPLHVTAPSAGLTDSELRATPLALPTGAATEATLAAVNAKLPALANGRMQVELPADSAPGLTDAELRAAPVAVAGTFYPPTQPVSLDALPLPVGASTELTLAALKTVIDSLLVVAQSIQTAASSLNTKTTAVNTGAIAGSVAVSNFPETQAVSGVVTVRNFPAGGTGLTDAELRASPVPITGSLATSPDDTLAYLLNAILEKMPRVDAADRLLTNGSEVAAAVSVSSGTVTTVGTVSNQTNIGGRDAAHASFALANMGALHIYNNIQVTA